MNQYINRCLKTCLLVFLYGYHSAYAGIWHVGVEAQQIYLTFKPTDINALNGLGTSYTQNADGQGIAGAIDYETQLYQALWLSLQGTLSYDNAIWSQNNSEASYQADIAWRYGFSMLPELRLNKKYTIFVELGIEEGLAKRDKDSEVLGTYKNSQWLVGGTLGAGMRYDMNDRLGLFVSYRFTQFQNYEFYVQGEDQAIIQVVKDHPYSSVASLGLSIAI